MTSALASAELLSHHVLMNTTTAFKQLKSDMKKARSAYADGTVVRFKKNDQYTYVALFVEANQTWYTTSQNEYFMDSTLTTGELIDTLSRSDVTEVAMAIEWATV